MHTRHGDDKPGIRLLLVANCRQNEKNIARGRGSAPQSFAKIKLVHATAINFIFSSERVMDARNFRSRENILELEIGTN